MHIYDLFALKVTRVYFKPKNSLYQSRSSGLKTNCNMILSDTRILEEINKGTIKIEPYDRESLGSNSYDVHLGKWLATYKDHILDAKRHNEIEYFEIPEEGFVLYPHVFLPGRNTGIHRNTCPRSIS